MRHGLHVETSRTKTNIVSNLPEFNFPVLMLSHASVSPTGDITVFVVPTCCARLLDRNAFFGVILYLQNGFHVYRTDFGTITHQCIFFCVIHG